VLFAGGQFGRCAFHSEIFDPLNDDFTSAVRLRQHDESRRSSAGRWRVLVIGGHGRTAQCFGHGGYLYPVTARLELAPAFLLAHVGHGRPRSMAKVVSDGGSNGSQDLVPPKFLIRHRTDHPLRFKSGNSAQRAQRLPAPITIPLIGVDFGGADLKFCRTLFS
jgi:hypothetical protein